MWKWLTMGVVAFTLLVPVAQAARDITGPLDVVQGYPNDGPSTANTNGWPPNEVPRQICDDQITTKFLHFKGEVETTGARITPAMGETVVTGVTFTSANDAEARDPIKYELSGSNESIDGPYTLIASGDIKDFAGAAVWPRRTKTTTPMRFTNTVAYKHYQILFPAIRNPAGADSMQIAEVELLMDVFKATQPEPKDGAILPPNLPLFRWTKGDTAVLYSVYLGTSPDLTEADLKASRKSGQPLYYHLSPPFEPLEPGVTYFWRVDQIDAAGNVYTGDVWSVLAAPKKAYNPEPRDGDKWLSTTTLLSWSEGVGASSHDLYFGTDEAAVAARDASVSKGTLNVPAYDPGLLLEKTTYWWAVDETIANVKYPGAVWSFTTEGGGGGIRGDYFLGTTPSGTPAMSRIDPEVNFNWAAEAPDATLPTNGWSARWTADLDIAITDTYTFYVTSEGGTRLRIDGKLMIDQWVSWVPTTYASLPIRLERGIHSLELEFADFDRNAQQELYWSTATMPQVIIPAGPLQPPVRARAINPSNSAANVRQDTLLMWGAGDKADVHQIYFGTDEQAVADATPETAGIYRGEQAQDETTFDLGELDWNTTYFWKIDEVNDAEADSPWKGSVWSFTTADFLVVDDMETYTDDEGNRIFESWLDGYQDDTNGSLVGYIDAPFAEQTIVNTGKQSMPFEYDNTGTSYSQAERVFSSPVNWTVNDVNQLTLFVRGYPAVGEVAITETAGKISLTGSGADIWGNSDQFTYAFKTLTGDGTMVARVTNIGPGTNTWAKGGVMIRDSINGNSMQAMMAMTANTDGTAGNGASFQYRATTGGASANADSITVVAAPYWVKIERSGVTLSGYTSNDGKLWSSVGSMLIEMTDPVCIGLAVTSHVATEQRTYQFDSISTTGSVSGAWKGAVISAAVHNSNEPLYVIVEDSTGKKATATNATAVTTGAWTEVKIPLSDFAGVNTTKVKKLILGVGNPAGPASGGLGRIFIDDIRVTKP